MNWEKISKLQGKKFRRYTGIYRSVYDEMLNCVKRIKTNRHKHPTKGVESALSIEDQLLITVMYWREYQQFSLLAKKKYESTQAKESRL
jgi:hypothetical protein